MIDLRVGDCREVLRTLEPESVHAVITDPPYGIGFMGREWDTFSPAAVQHRGQQKRRKTTERTSKQYPNRMSKTSQGGGPSVSYDESASGNQRFQAWCQEWAEECLRVLKPGGHMVVFGGPRTFHRVVSGIEDAGFQIRDVLMWLCGSGFPKSRNLDGAWDGWGTAMKPGYEPILLARKPFKGSVERNMLQHGTGAIHIDVCRIGSSGSPTGASDGPSNGIFGDGLNGVRGLPVEGLGRWPANVILDEAAAEMLDAEVGERPAGGAKSGKSSHAAAFSGNLYGDAARNGVAWDGYQDIGGASRFFYTAKASSFERHVGLDDLPNQTVMDGRTVPIDNAFLRGETPRKNTHPTVKPISIMRWLVKLVCPPGSTVVDPFVGSGTTGCAVVLEPKLNLSFIGIDLEPQHIAIAERRIEYWRKSVSLDGLPMFVNLEGDAA